jgi:hypothetical protein
MYRPSGKSKMICEINMTRAIHMRLVSAFLSMILFAIEPAAAQIAQPQLGYMRDASGLLRPIFGIAAAATLGAPVLENVISFACSAKWCLAKTDAALVSFTPSGGTEGVAAPAGPAIIAHANHGAWIYYSSTMQLARWKDGALTSIDFSPDGRVLSLRATADGLDYAVIRGGSALVWIEHFSPSDGSVTLIDFFALNSFAPDSFAIESGAVAKEDVANEVMLLDGGVLASSHDHVTLRRADGTELTFPVTGASAFHAAGNGYVQISASSGMWILRTDPGHEQLSLLPGAPQGALQRAPPGALQSESVQRAPQGVIQRAPPGAIQ